MHCILGATFLFFHSIAFCLAAESEDWITYLPGLEKPLPFRQYSGYLDASNTEHFHYWFIESENKPKSEPLVLWLFGGPGCSSIDGVLSQNGPFRVNNDGFTLQSNPHSWNKAANMLYIESPAGVGYSYDDNGDVSTNDDKIAKSHYNALLSFFKKFPEYLPNPLFIFGVSYGGVYVPMLCVNIQQGEYKLNLQGMGIGNGVTSYPMIENSVMFYAYYHGLLGDTQWKSLTSNCCNGMPSKENCDFVTNKKIWCQSLVYRTFLYFYSLGINRYSIYSDCSTGFPARLSQYKRIMKALYNIEPVELKKLDRYGESNVGSTMPCINSTAETTWMNRPDVRRALHIKSGLPAWSVCSDTANYTSLHPSMEKQYKQLLRDPAFRVLVYNGDVDVVCNFLGDDWFLNSLNVTLVKEQAPWYVGGQLAGFAKTFRQIVFTTIRGAGHMSSDWKPAYTLAMLRKFLNNQPFV